MEYLSSLPKKLRVKEKHVCLVEQSNPSSGSIWGDTYLIAVTWTDEAAIIAGGTTLFAWAYDAYIP